MRIRDPYATLNNDPTFAEMPNGLQIIDDDDRAFMTIKQNGPEIEINTGGVCKIGGIIYDSQLMVEPIAANSVSVRRKQYIPDTRQADPETVLAELVAACAKIFELPRGTSGRIILEKDDEEALRKTLIKIRGYKG